MQHSRRALSWALTALLLTTLTATVAACKIPAAPVREGSTPTIEPSRIVRTFAAPEQVIDPAKNYVATIRTDKGTIIIQLLPTLAPNVVNNFVFLAQKHFYDGLAFHNIVPNFLAQAGDPLGDGSGGPGYELEEDKNELKNEKGAVSMAKGANSTKVGSQFFINLADNASLDRDTATQKRFYPFGRVVAGLDIAATLVTTDTITSVVITNP